MNGKFPLEKDLPEEWQQLTGLPFVFAVWASRKPQSEEFVRAFEFSLAEGFKAIDSVIAEQQIAYPETDVRKYLTQSISYDFDARKAEAMKVFLAKL
jgi:chorismate dehydratase